MWDQKLRNVMEKYAATKFGEKFLTGWTRFFLGLRVESPVQRNNYFMQTDKTIFQQEPFADSLPHPPKVGDIHIRHERQTLRRLPRSGAVMFMVRTYLTPVKDLQEERDNLFALREAVEAWPPGMARYKGRHVWGDVLAEFCDKVLGGYVPKGDMD
jgi:hypothetical protein